MTAPVTDAVAAVDYDHFVTEPDGSTLPQSSSISSIQQMLQAFDVRPGHRVLEIGTGSGYTTGLRDRQRRLRRRPGWSPVRPCRGLGHAAPDPVRLDRSGKAGRSDRGAGQGCPPRPAHAIVTVTVTGGRPMAVSARPGGYIEMHPEPVAVFGLPLRYVDAAHVPDGAEPWWLSSPALREDPDAARRLLDLLRSAQGASPTPLAETEDLDDFTAWLYATVPAELATAGLSDRFAAIGVATRTGAAFLTDDELVTSGSPGAAHTLTSWINQWRDEGRPGWSDVAGVVVPTTEGWEIRLTSSPRTPDPQEQ